MRGISKFQNVLLTAGAALGVLCLLFAVAGVLFGIKPLMFKSGSMDPTIPTGALALSIPVDAADIHVGDIVSTENSASVRITHRVAAVQPADGYTVLTLKGDANEVVDAEVYPVTEVDRVIWSAPLLGYVVAWLSSSVALFLGGLLTAYLLYLAFAPRVRKDSATKNVLLPRRSPSKPSLGRRVHRSSPRRSKYAARRAHGMTAVLTVLLTSAILPPDGPAWAEFTDVAEAKAPLGARKLQLPALTCSDEGGSLLVISNEQIRLRWSHKETEFSPTGYVLTRAIGTNSATVIGEYGPEKLDLVVDPSTINSRTTVQVTYGITAKYFQKWRTEAVHVKAEYRPSSLLTSARLDCVA